MMPMRLVTPPSRRKRPVPTRALEKNRADYDAVAYCSTGSDESTCPKLMIRNRFGRTS